MYCQYAFLCSYVSHITCIYTSLFIHIPLACQSHNVSNYVPLISSISGHYVVFEFTLFFVYAYYTRKHHCKLSPPNHHPHLGSSPLQSHHSPPPQNKRNTVSVASNHGNVIPGIFALTVTPTTTVYLTTTGMSFITLINSCIHSLGLTTAVTTGEISHVNHEHEANKEE